MKAAQIMTPEQHERDVLGLQVAQDGSTLMIRLRSPHGEIRLSDTNLRALTMRVREGIDAGVTWLVLDLRHCFDVNDKALGVLVSIRNTLRLGVTIVAADDYVRSRFDLTRIAPLFQFWPQLPDELWFQEHSTAASPSSGREPGVGE